MNKKRIIDPQAKIEFPSFFIIPFFSLILSIIKLFNGSSLDWIMILVILPIGLYFGICICWCILTALVMIILKKYKGN